MGCYIGTQTNNYAEYMGLLFGVRAAALLGVQYLRCKGDSEVNIILKDFIQ